MICAGKQFILATGKALLNVVYVPTQVYTTRRLLISHYICIDWERNHTLRPTEICSNNKKTNYNHFTKTTNILSIYFHCTKCVYTLRTTVKQYIICAP